MASEWGDGPGGGIALAVGTVLLLIGLAVLIGVTE